MNDNIIIKILKQNKYILFEYLKVKGIRYTVNVEETSLRMDSIDSDNLNGLCLSLNNMSFYDFKTLQKGNVLDLLSILTNLNKYMIMFEIKSLVDKSNYELSKIDSNDFIEYEKKELLEYPKGLLNLYPCTISELFLNDNINEATQLMFDIKYDKESDRILIPVIFKNNLVGMIGRYNNSVVPKNVPKYYPILTYPKSEVLFGYDLCESDIRKTKTVILVESEKSVMKSIQIGLFNTLAVGGSNVSKSQIKLLNELGVERVFISFDSDKEEEKLLTQINKWFDKSNIKVYFTNNNTKYISEKSCIFDMNWDKKKTLNYIKKYSTKVLN